MTHRPVRVMPDGRRVYADGHVYRPVPAAERKRAVRKPQDPRAVRWGGEWLLPLPLIPERLRRMPETRPDSEAYDHMERTFNCRCEVCSRPDAKRWRNRWRKDNGLRPLD